MTGGTSHTIRNEAIRLGFSHCGFARPYALEHLRPFYLDYLSKGGHEGFRYIAGHLENRLNPGLLLDHLHSVIAVLMNYYPPVGQSPDDHYRIARYALGRDYHPLMRQRMKALELFITTTFPGHTVRSFVDSGPVLEKQWAQQCGLGFIGKHSLLVNRESGSYFFIGIILTTLETEPDQPGTDGCGTCDRCIRACPTGALHTPYVLDIRRCIAYHTIEKKEPMTGYIKERLGGRIFGCDACQEACPYNRFAVPTQVTEFRADTELLAMQRDDWEALTSERFSKLFGNSSIGRTGYENLMENIRAAGDSGSGTPPVAG